MHYLARVTGWWSHFPPSPRLSVKIPQGNQPDQQLGSHPLRITWGQTDERDELKQADRCHDIRRNGKQWILLWLKVWLTAERKINQIVKSYFLCAAVSSIVRVLNKWISLKVWSRLCMTSRDKPLLAKTPAGWTKDGFEMVQFFFLFFFVGCNDVNSVTNILFGVKVTVNDPFLCNKRHFKK